MADSIEVELDVSTPDGPLSLSEAGKYEVVAWGPGSLSWRRRKVQSDYQHGSRAIGEVLEAGTTGGVVRVYGETWADVRTNQAAMFEAFAQHIYTITTVIDGVTDIYVCEPADISIVGGDVWQKPQLYACMQEYLITAPYNPQEVITS